MKKVYEYSHLGGAEILKVRYPAIDADIDAVIAEISEIPKIASKEKTKVGQMVFSPKAINKKFKDGLKKKGFKEKRAPFTVELPNYPVTIKGAFKQIDFVRDAVLVEVQLGKYSYMFYDMAKFQYFFNDESAEVGVEIVPCHNFHSGMSSGTSYGEQLIGDIIRLRRHFPAVPVKIILIDEDHAVLPSAMTEVEEPEEEVLLASEGGDAEVEAEDGSL